LSIKFCFYFFEYADSLSYAVQNQSALNESVNNVSSFQSDDMNMSHINRHIVYNNDLSRISKSDESPACMSERYIDLNSSVGSNELANQSATGFADSSMNRTPPQMSINDDERMNNNDTIICNGKNMSPIPISSGIYDIF